MKNISRLEKICIGLILLISVICHSGVFAQEEWMPMETPTDAKLNAVDFITSMKGIAVGNNGTVIITNDGGLSWTLTNSQVSNNLKSISFIDEDHAVAVGDGGQIIVTENGGVNWTSHWLPGVQNNLYAVDMTPEGKGIASGQRTTLLYTVNGGINWSIIEEGASGHCQSVRYYNDSIAYVFGILYQSQYTGTIRKLINGIVTEVSVAYFEFENGVHDGCIYDGYIFDEESIVTVGKIDIYPRVICNITCNQDLNSSLWYNCYTEESCSLKGVDFIGSFGVAVGGQEIGEEAPSILESNDMGESWEMIYKGKAGDPNMNDVKLIENTGYIVGNNGAVWKKLLPTGFNYISIGIENALTVTPNPVNENSIISFELSESSVVQLSLYDINGRIVRKLYNGNMCAGSHKVGIFDNFSNFEIPRGLYLLKMKTNKSISTIKVVF